MNNNPQIESKNLTILEDQLTLEALATKKYKLAAQQCTSQDIVDLCNQAYERHKKHYDDLFNYLNSHQ